ncbi:hypothetical protein Pmar_PMAR001953 [Perkinsus marinus ATCC 50983]|uniref:Integrase catalytic domain-containing protein n=2 Tax=Perkinsus marinus (strain ATCC 50983 / TXsc) TaxID=423536 RepID=C5KZR8_PERM5|nr:hypothetical protein Pmar_PMAR001953 [Perkinsus marinus ATCC 50983]EER10025.1 hypothetical protein Pmar_PMAR001953 [Perkinsus marinus ATCC 50983]|eukprot:XP_002778230.1 hypothetical protein Pmar_PMAR001953 [Perkinsus marinus ATCC 50983]
MAVLRTDRGPCFRSKPFADFVQSRAIAHKLLPPYSPFSNGIVERAVAAVKFVARQVASKRSWPTQLGRAISRLNNKPLSGIALSPHEIFFARRRRFSVENAVIPADEGAVHPAGSEEATSREEVRDEIDRIVNEARAAEAELRSQHLGRRPRGPPPVGSEVLIFSPNPLGGGSYGQEIYRVCGVIGAVTLRLVKASIKPEDVTDDKIKEVHLPSIRGACQSTLWIGAFRQRMRAGDARRTRAHVIDHRRL